MFIIRNGENECILIQVFIDPLKCLFTIFKRPCLLLAAAPWPAKTIERPKQSVLTPNSLLPFRHFSSEKKVEFFENISFNKYQILHSLLHLL